MREDRPVADLLLDYLLYAPLGAAVVVSEELPKLAERGRQRFGRQISAAEMLGRFAVAEGRRRLAAETRDRREASPGVPQTSPRASAPTSEPGAPDPSLRPSQPPVEARRAVRAPKAANARPSAKAGPTGVLTGRVGHELAIPAYDTLAASQVVERLASLSPAELESVRKHESATRRRRTVLHKIAQLNAERDGATA